MTATADPEPRQPDWRREFREFDADGDKVLHVEYRDAKPRHYTYRNPTHQDPYNSGICIDVSLLVPRRREAA